jgi:hypothetical protein
MTALGPVLPPHESLFRAPTDSSYVLYSRRLASRTDRLATTSRRVASTSSRVNFILLISMFGSFWKAISWYWQAIASCLSSSFPALIFLVNYFSPVLMLSLSLCSFCPLHTRTSHLISSWRSFIYIMSPFNWFKTAHNAGCNFRPTSHYVI